MPTPASTRAVTFEAMRDHIGKIPSMAPRPNNWNITGALKYVVSKLQAWPSSQSRTEGYSGAVQNIGVYALTGEPKFKPVKNPGPHRPIDPSLNREGQADKQIAFDYEKEESNSYENMLQAVIYRMNECVPVAYRRSESTGIGVRDYKMTDCPRKIFQDLIDKYGKMSPAERTAMERIWATLWNPRDPIESFFTNLEEVFIQASQHGPAYTSEQLVSRAITSIDATGLML